MLPRTALRYLSKHFNVSSTFIVPPLTTCSQLHAACVDPAIAISLTDLLLQYGPRLEDSPSLFFLVQCKPYESPDHHEKNRSDDTLSPESSMILAHEDSEPDEKHISASSKILVFQHLPDLEYLGASCHGPALH